MLASDLDFARRDPEQGVAVHHESGHHADATCAPDLFGRIAQRSFRSTGLAERVSPIAAILLWVPNASRIAHAGLAFANPISEAALDAAIAVLPLPAEPLVLDLGCGSGEMLLRILRRHVAARGLGIDLDADAIAEARRRAGMLPARFEVRDAATVEGTFDAVLNVGASHALGGFPKALKALKRLGRAVLYGEGFWRRRPSDDFLAALGGASVDELSDLDGLRAATAAAGFDIAREWVASEEDWMSYEETLAANAEHHGTPDTLAYARRIRDRRALPDGTDTLGFALLLLET